MDHLREVRGFRRGDRPPRQPDPAVVKTAPKTVRITVIGYDMNEHLASVTVGLTGGDAVAPRVNWSRVVRVVNADTGRELEGFVEDMNHALRVKFQADSQDNVPRWWLKHMRECELADETARIQDRLEKKREPPKKPEGPPSPQMQNLDRMMNMLNSPEWKAACDLRRNTPLPRGRTAYGAEVNQHFYIERAFERSATHDRPMMVVDKIEDFE